MTSPLLKTGKLVGIIFVALGFSNQSGWTQTTPQYDTTLYHALEWRSIGPYRGGRVTAVTGVVGQRSVYYMGATGGGVWKTEDGGLSWHPIADDFLEAGSIGAIAVAESDPNVVYVGTGESPIRGNVSPGVGVYKSWDAGKTWEHVGLPEAGQIGAIRVHPRDPDLVYVAALGHVFGPNEERGVYRSQDGGRTWERILYRSPDAGAIDLAMDPSNPRILYAGFWEARRFPWAMESGGPGGGLFKSTDGGDSWNEITRNEGLPQGTIGKVGVTVSPARPDRVWAIVEAEDGGVFRSDDGGERWTRVNDDRSLRQRAWYYTHIHADPKDPETVYVLNVRLYRSVDGGKSYSTISAPHGDHHALWIDPQDPQRMINGNDGGANVSLNGGESWTAQDNQATAQMYHVTTTNDFPYRVCGAQQDNSTLCIASRTDGFGITSQDWHRVGGCESGYIAPHPVRTHISYAGCYGGQMSRHDRQTGQNRNVMVWPDNPMGWGAADLRYRFQWTFPILFDPHDPNVIYAAGNVLFRSEDEGQSWQAISPDLTRNDKSKQQPSGGPITKDNTSVEYYNTIFAVAPSLHEPGVLWVGTDDGLVHITRDGGTNWTDVTPDDLPEWALISIIEASPHDPGTAYLAATRYKLDDFTPYIFKTNDYGRSWDRIVDGIPAEHFIRVVREDPDRRGLLYAAGEFGVYVSFDDGERWQSLQLNLPVVPIHDMVVKEKDLVVGTHGRSFWILDDLTPLHELDDQVASARYHLFPPRAAYRMNAAGGAFRGGGGVGQNPPSGVMIHYLLPEDSLLPEAKLTILDSAGDTVRTYSSSDTANAREELSTDPGLNRFVWDLRYPGFERFPGMIMWAASSRGPLAPPGTYRVQVSAGDWSETRSFEVLKDPRVSASQADLEEQFRFAMSVRDRVSEANNAVSRIREIKKSLADLRERLGDEASADSVLDRAEELEEELSDIESGIYQVKNRSRQDPLNYPIRLNNRLAYLLGVVGSADARPTEQSREVFRELSSALQVFLDRLEAVIAERVPELNDMVRELALPAVPLGS